MDGPLRARGDPGGGDGLPEPLSPADLGIFFYSAFGDFGGQAGPTTTAEYDVTEPGGETGFVAPGSRYGVVFVKSGFDVDFTYRGFTPMTVDVSETGFNPTEVTVGRGGWVVWENVGEDFHSATASDGTFDSSPTEKKPIIPGVSFAVRFLSVKDIEYFDRFGEATGVVHVEPGPGPGTPQ